MKITSVNLFKVSSFPKTGLWILFAVFFVMLSSCSNDDDAPEKPAVTITFSKSELKYFSGESDLVFTSPMGDDIASARILVDGVEVFSETFDSPSAEVTFSWDTKSVEDGQHTITVVVTNETGQETTETYDIVVRNILMKYVCEANSIL